MAQVWSMPSGVLRAAAPRRQDLSGALQPLLLLLLPPPPRAQPPPGIDPVVVVALGSANNRCRAGSAIARRAPGPGRLPPGPLYHPLLVWDQLNSKLALFRLELYHVRSEQTVSSSLNSAQYAYLSISSAPTVRSLSSSRRFNPLRCHSTRIAFSAPSSGLPWPASPIATEGFVKFSRSLFPLLLEFRAAERIADQLSHRVRGELTAATPSQLPRAPDLY